VLELREPATKEDHVTCIVGVQHQGRVLIGGDSAGVAGHSINARADSKVFRVGDYVMGFTTSFRMGQLLRYSLHMPEPDSWDVDRFMATQFVDKVRTCLRDGGWATTDNGREVGGTFLVGIRGHLYLIDSDFQIGRVLDGYDAVGCGQDLALGSLHTTRDSTDARARVTKALEAAAHHSAGVAGPFVIEETSR
jgi:ATP-dependent protease HslVU (ClpYQ) peptidase subunit